MKPVIAITGRRISADSLVDVDARWSAVEADMFWADFSVKISDAGGLPVLLPYEAVGPEIIDRVDGLVVTGGQDVDPEIWGGPPPTPNPTGGQTLAIDRRRDDYEIALVRLAIERRIPVLGVCRGHQIINVGLGGTLISDLTDQGTQHYSLERFPDCRPEGEHVVHFDEGTLAGKLYGPRCGVSSWHHQAVDRIGEGLVVSGRAPDGVVESIESPDGNVLGVQWHPEARSDLEPCFTWLVTQARSTLPTDNQKPHLGGDQ
ncbi:gamma-glutamyl-gamma-aminobutyrate hydrolase family protein [Rhodococcus erythropolis]|uniref:gamma-glutamyl-gamma-aminobutyrate hydrolase family protein n=1 Tax=Rhodococcus erythropolis TaxID=1833 RepID=UPI001BE8F86F|nr:gamma-glutamyl-gamma-aminobutyrate hydrolase family protein [Rhodococcus erythropolis]MBT2263456.1 gamma-glutamyl-gamma-aminobutyrate hydrolase family protein [Rhodococcus erythropolis]